MDLLCSLTGGDQCRRLRALVGHALALDAGPEGGFDRGADAGQVLMPRPGAAVAQQACQKSGGKGPGPNLRGQ